MKRLFGAIFQLALIASTNQAQVTSQDLVKGPGENWLTYHGDYAAKRFSPLKEINIDTIKELVPKWIRHFDTPPDLEATPIVFGGTMYTTSGNDVYALDALTGAEVWHYRATGSQKRGVNRGVAILGNEAYFTTADCHLVSLRRTNGAVLWDQPYASAAEGYSCSGAPLAVRDKLIVGVAVWKNVRRGCYCGINGKGSMARLVGAERRRTRS